MSVDRETMNSYEKYFSSLLRRLLKKQRISLKRSEFIFRWGKIRIFDLGYSSFSSVFFPPFLLGINIAVARCRSEDRGKANCECVTLLCVFGLDVFNCVAGSAFPTWCLQEVWDHRFHYFCPLTLLNFKHGKSSGYDSNWEQDFHH